MTVLTLDREMAACDRTRRKTLAGSLVAHSVLLVWLALYQHIAPQAPALVEITWLEPEPEPAAAPRTPIPPQPTVEVRETKPSPPPADRKFQREETVAEIEPEPQKPLARDDRLSERLAALRDSRPTQATALPTTNPISAWSRTPAAAETPRPSSAPTDLVRDEAKPRSPSPSTLRRETTTRTRPSLAVTRSVQESRLSPAPAKIDENTARRTLDGASLLGPVADRPLEKYGMPIYPEWAKRDAIEATVTLYFVVLPDGRIKDGIVVKKTSGYADFDRNAEAALREWKFEPLPTGAGREQWGTITFNFRLRDTR
jgi:TonB family protein